MSFGPEWAPMQNLVIGMWRKRKQTFSSPRVGSSPAMCQQATCRLPAKYRYLFIQKNVQDGSVWLMIGKSHLKRRDKVSFAPETDVPQSLLRADTGRSSANACHCAWK
jgi:hypothetical protein